MLSKIIIPLLAVAGLMVAIQTVRSSGQVRPANPPVAEPARSPFVHSVAGSGIIEASSENIAIGTNIGGIVAKVFVKPGDTVKAGDPLFQIDSRTLQSELATREASLAQARAKLAKLRAMPRLEELPPLEARVLESEATLADMQNQLATMESVDDPRAIIKEQLDRRRFAVRIAETRVTEARAALAQMKAGAWAPDLAIAESDVAQAEALVNATKTEIDRLTVRAPISGEVLQRNVRPGEFAAAGTASKDPLVLLGNTEILHIRADIDENDAWRLNAGAKARASLRGNGDIFTDVSFVRIEPYVVPKKSLTGESTERVDTRVLQILFAFPRASMKAYVGQLVDVRIEAAALEQKAAPTPGPTEPTPASRN